MASTIGSFQEMGGDALTRPLRDWGGIKLGPFTGPNPLIPSFLDRRTVTHVESGPCVNSVCCSGRFRTDNIQLLLEDASYLCHPIAAKPVPK